jgi:hypothetical protein
LLVEDFHRRTEGRRINLMTSDENPAYVEAIVKSYEEEYKPRRRGRRGRTPARRHRGFEKRVCGKTGKNWWTCGASDGDLRRKSVSFGSQISVPS